MKYVILALTFVVSACAPPLAPTPIDVAPAVLVPAALTLTGGTATSVGEVLLNLTVVDATGKGVGGAAVTLTTTSGTFNHATVITAPNGTGQAVLTTTADATVTATLGTLTVTAKALAFPIFVAPPNPPPLPPPPVVVIPPPATCATTPSLCPAPTLAAVLTCTPAAHTLASVCNVTATFGGSAIIATSITNVDWNWGDGLKDTGTTTPVLTHTYANAGTYPVFAFVSVPLLSSIPAEAVKVLVIP